MRPGPRSRIRSANSSGGTAGISAGASGAYGGRGISAGTGRSGERRPGPDRVPARGRGPTHGRDSASRHLLPLLPLAHPPILAPELIIAVAAISKYSRIAPFATSGARRVLECGEHRGDPRVPLRCADGERRVPHAQARVTLLGAVFGRTAPVLREEHRERALARREVLGIQAPQHGIELDVLVEVVDERVEVGLTADDLEHGNFRHAV